MKFGRAISAYVKTQFKDEPWYKRVLYRLITAYYIIDNSYTETNEQRLYVMQRRMALDEELRQILRGEAPVLTRYRLALLPDGSAFLWLEWNIELLRWALDELDYRAKKGRFMTAFYLVIRADFHGDLETFRGQIMSNWMDPFYNKVEDAMVRLRATIEEHRAELEATEGPKFMSIRSENPVE